MKPLLFLAQVVLGVILITYGCNQVSQPSDLLLTVGIVSVLTGLVLLYFPLKALINQF